MKSNFNSNLMLKLSLKSAKEIDSSFATDTFINRYEVTTASKQFLSTPKFKQKSTLDGKLLNFFDSSDITHVLFVLFFISTLDKIKTNKQP